MLPPRLFAFSLLFRFIMSISYSGFKLMSTKNMPGRKKVLRLEYNSVRQLYSSPGIIAAV